jgi:exopolyphosphatase
VKYAEYLDLDSCCSSIAYAWFLSQTVSRQVIPLLNITKPELKLRPELSSLMSTVDVDMSSLCLLDDLYDSLDAKSTDWILVDHNIMTRGLKRKFGARVCGVVDHHEDGGLYESAEPRIIQKSGSCASLVLEKWQQVIESTKSRDVLSQVLLVATAAISIDTANLKARVTDHDKKAMEIVKAALSLSRPEVSLDKLYMDMFKAKSEIPSELDFRDILRKDYKEWEVNDMKVGISSMVKDLEWVRRNRQDWIDHLKAWREEKSLDILMIMTSSGSVDTFHREILLWIPNQRDLLDKFQEKGGSVFDLIEVKSFPLDLENCKVWDQHDLSSSRKQLAPFVLSLLKS